MKRKKVQTVLTEHLAGMNIDGGGGAGASSDIVIMKARKGDGQRVFVEPVSTVLNFQWDALFDFIVPKDETRQVQFIRASLATHDLSTGRKRGISLFYLSGPGFCIQLEVKIGSTNQCHNSPTTNFFPSSLRDLSIDADAIEVDKAIAVIWDKSLFDAYCTSAQTIFND